jgi:eukaryotic-like serine/threonine-protein kinase
MRKRPPAWLGPYRPLAVIGGGAYGSVYSAQDPSGALVAIRALPSWLVEDASAKRRLFELLDALRRLEHPGLCAVCATGEDDRAAYVVTELVAGIDLKHLGANPSSGPEWPWQVAGVIADAADAVGALHHAGQLHEGIADQNVVIKWDGAVKVMDLGLERIGQTLPMTRTGTVRGRFRYYAPEKLENAPPTPGRDVWSLGVIAWELLSGTKLTSAKNDVDSIVAITSMPVPPLPAHVPAVLASIVLGCLARDPSARFRDASELANALRQAVARSDVAAPRGTLAEKLRFRFRKELVRWRKILAQTGSATEHGDSR